MSTRLVALAERLKDLQQALTTLDQDSATRAPNGVDRREALAERRRAIIEELADIEAALSESDAVPPGPDVEGDALAAAGGLAVMVGHQQTSPGAPGASPPFPPQDRFEYRWNADLAQRIQAFAEARSIRCKIFTRDGLDIEAAYRPVKAWQPAATVELHFNSSDQNPTAKGTLTVYGADASKAWAQTLQDKMVALFGRQGHREDRGIHVPGPDSGYARGTKNVIQIHPSALIEPFFGHNPADAKLGIDRKQNLAEAIVAAYAAFTGTAPVTPVTPIETVTPSAGSALPESPLFAELRRTYEAMTLVIPDLDPAIAQSLKSITLAQWAEESGWGTSDLASQHFNFAGMKALSEVSTIIDRLSAGKVWYQAHDGFDWYLRFGRLEDYINGYWMFLDRSPYSGWRDKAKQSPHDFIRFIGRKWSNNNPGYAERLISIERRILEAAQQRPAEGPDLPPVASPTSPLGAVNLSAIPANAPLFRELIDTNLPADADLAKVHIVLAAQWALESNWGRSALATRHFNFAGIEWSDSLADLAGRVKHPTNPEKGDYCRFIDLAGFAKGYLQRLEREARFAGWRTKTGSAEDFIAFLSEKWRPTDPSYSQSLKLRYRDLASPFSPPAAGAGPEAPVERPQIDQLGFVIKLKRTHCERRTDQTYDRTVGTYQVFFNGVPLPGLSGLAFERQGPGDNAATGRQAQRRIKAGTYALSTHSGSRTNSAGVTLYKTIGFTSDAQAGAAPRPSVRLMDTGAREGILFHPGRDYLSSIGCFNLSKPLGRLGAIDWTDSRKHVIDVIQAMRDKLGAAFPSGNNVKIPNTFMIIEGEPGPAGSGEDILATRNRSAKEFGLDQLAAVRSRLASDIAAAAPPSDTYNLIATALTASAEAGEIEGGLFDQAIANVSDLSGLRDENRNTLWFPWVTACATAETINDLAERGRALARLAEIADRLVARGVPINAREGTHTPMVNAAIANSPAALSELLRLGTDIDLHDRQGMTPLQAAAFYGSLEAVRYLLERGADHRALTQPPIAPEADIAAAGDSAEAVDPEALPANLRAIDCARQGKLLAVGNDERLDMLEAVISALWDKENQ